MEEARSVSPQKRPRLTQQQQGQLSHLQALSDVNGEIRFEASSPNTTGSFSDRSTRRQALLRKIDFVQSIRERLESSTESSLQITNIRLRQHAARQALYDARADVLRLYAITESVQDNFELPSSDHYANYFVGQADVASVSPQEEPEESTKMVVPEKDPTASRTIGNENRLKEIASIVLGKSAAEPRKILPENIGIKAQKRSKFREDHEEEEEASHSSVLDSLEQVEKRTGASGEEIRDNNHGGRQPKNVSGVPAKAPAGTPKTIEQETSPLSSLTAKEERLGKGNAARHEKSAQKGKERKTIGSAATATAVGKPLKSLEIDRNDPAGKSHKATSREKVMADAGINSANKSLLPGTDVASAEAKGVPNVTAVDKTDRPMQTAVTLASDGEKKLSANGSSSNKKDGSETKTAIHLDVDDDPSKGVVEIAPSGRKNSEATSSVEKLKEDVPEPKGLIFETVDQIMGSSEAISNKGPSCSSKIEPTNQYGVDNEQPEKRTTESRPALGALPEVTRRESKQNVGVGITSSKDGKYVTVDQHDGVAAVNTAADENDRSAKANNEADSSENMVDIWGYGRRAQDPAQEPFSTQKIDQISDMQSESTWPTSNEEPVKQALEENSTNTVKVTKPTASTQDLLQTALVLDDNIKEQNTLPTQMDKRLVEESHDGISRKESLQSEKTAKEEALKSIGTQGLKSNADESAMMEDGKTGGLPKRSEFARGECNQRKRMPMERCPEVDVESLQGRPLSSLSHLFIKEPLPARSNRRKVDDY